MFILVRNSGAQNFLTEVTQSDFEVISKAQNQLFYCIWTLGSKWIKQENGWMQRYCTILIDLV